jgi:uncharacterized phosphosugar-binding protein
MPSLVQSYRDMVATLLDAIAADRDGSLEQAIQAVAAALADDRIIHVAGSGHSHMLAEEVFYRAGGIAAAQAMLDPDLMLHLGARRSSAMERQEGVAADLLRTYRLGPGDIVFVASNSGRNAFPVELALGARALGAVTIAITSLATAREVSSRHGSGKLLCDVCDIVIDNHVPVGDATLQVPGRGQRMGPVSTLAGVFILNAILAEAVARAEAQGRQIDVYQSANGPGDSETGSIAERWQARIRGL